MQINAAFLPKISEEARLAAMAEASQLLQEVGTMMKAKKARSITLGSRYADNFRLTRRRW